MKLRKRDPATLSPASPKHRRLERAALLSLLLVVGYALMAYVVLPALWTHY